MVKTLFTDRAVKLLRRMAAKGRHAPEIGLKLGISRQLVAKKAIRLGIKITPTPVPVRTSDEKAEILRLYESGLGYGRIGKDMGLSIDVVRRTVGQIKRVSSMEENGMMTPDQRDQKLIDYWTAGMTVSQIAIRLNIGKSSVERHARRLEVEKRPSPILTCGVTLRLARHPDRDRCGAEPLPAFHPISWGAIALDNGFACDPLIASAA